MDPLSPVSLKGHPWHPKSASLPSWQGLSTVATVVAAGPGHRCGHLPHPRAPNQWGDPQADPCTPNPPSPGEERQEKPPGISGSQLWERPSRTCRCCSAQCKNHMSRGSGSAARSSGAVPRGRGLGRCFFWRSDILGNVCVALGPRGTDPSWKRRGIRAEDASPALIRNFPHL